jgi:hypothetical protein
MIKPLFNRYAEMSGIFRNRLHIQTRERSVKGYVKRSVKCLRRFIMLL